MLLVEVLYSWLTNRIYGSYSISTLMLPLGCHIGRTLSVQGHAGQRHAGLWQVKPWRVHAVHVFKGFTFHLWAVTSKEIS